MNTLLKEPRAEAWQYNGSILKKETQGSPNVAQKRSDNTGPFQRGKTEETWASALL